MMRQHGSGQQTTWLPRTASAGFGGAIIDRAEARAPLKDRNAIAANNPAREPTLLHRQTKRAANQASSDDGDLANWHEFYTESADIG